MTLVDRRILEALLEAELTRALGRNGAAPGLVLVHGRYNPAAPTEFTVRVGERQRQVRVSDQQSVLGVIGAWQHHRSQEPGADSLLVVTTQADPRGLGADVRAHALGRTTLSVDRAEIVKQRFGAGGLDPRIRQEGWLVDALLDAEPPDGWRTAPAAVAWRREGGTVLTRDAAVRALAEARLGLSAEAGGLDADSLLAWSRTPGAAARFAALPAAERDGLTGWLGQTAGAAATVLLRLAASGRADDAMALGVIGAVLTDPVATADVALAVGGLFAGIAAPEELRAFSAAVQGTLTRWIGEAERTDHHSSRDRVMAVLQRADRLAASAGLGQAMRGNAFLPSTLLARLHVLAAALPRSAREADEALHRVRDHRLAALFPARCEVAEMAVRLRRWIDLSAEDRVASVAAGVRRHLAEWGWVDRATNVLWAGDPEHDPVLGQAYRDLYEQVRSRRAELDRAFAGHLEGWARTAAAEAPAGTLPVESVMSQIVVPLAEQAPPLVLVLDGMSSAVAVQLGEQLTRTGRWLEATPTPPDRCAAVSMIPSVTTVSRASLLSGAPTTGGQAAEIAAFTAFWNRKRKQAVLFHKAAIAGGAGQRLAQPLLDALAGEQVVGVVLNTIDDGLDHDREGDRVGWRPTDITYLVDLLNAARDYRRPVILVSDHGHVLERGEPGTGPAGAPGAKAARWRTGTPGDGEIELSGPRVLEGGGRIVAPWREDIRYTPRKAGYHGGASLAEMTVPILVVLPSQDLLPKGWAVLPPERTFPSWWNAGPAQPVREPAAPPSTPRPAPLDSLGAQVTGSPLYAEQKKYLRKPPDVRQIAAVIDALAEAGGTLTPAAVSAAASAAGGRAARDPEQFIIAVQRLLNVEGYPVIGLIDGGRTVKLDEGLLREQFGLEEKR